MNRIIISNEQEKLNVKPEYEKIIAEAVNTSVSGLNIEGRFEVSVLIVDNAKIRELNREYRDIDKETDVLSFPMMDFSSDDAHLEKVWEYELLGDIVISLEKAAEQAGMYGHTIEREIGFLTVHSMLHLFGYDHESEDERQIMRRLEEGILEKMRLTRDGV